MSEMDENSLAAAPLDGEDARVLRMLRELDEARDPVPAGLTERIGFALTVAALEAEVAELTALSAEGAGVRGEMEVANTVSFSGADLTAMITIEPADDGSRRVSGWASATPVEVQLRSATGVQDTTTDAEGRFGFDHVRPGLVHLVLRRQDMPGTPPLITPPIEI
ncbi:hypothetical protein DDE18_08460 [Nocardioides gansuensis]|uniref:Carboxypeptidase regulatory-like domain-containing protein n=1 Tax=Nocardioides gansuensis TaxID=2138300 RepID=A0A2T8FC81_9ACTN|nr:carboxypeptidase regulatory-like domain-containing protein [Nocardioides gansuensis]PVG83317.1 hypothetical protein DDE18_08460 [Nocardioides gansuensis]